MSFHGRSFPLLCLMLAALPAARAEEREADEEIIVYGDRFARWDDTRWFVKTEVAMPFPILLAADRNLGFRTQMFQVRAILFCSKQHRKGPRHHLVDCAIEDLGIVAAAFDDEPPVPRERIQTVLDEIDAKLTGARFQLRVSHDGQVKGVDLEGWETRNRREMGIAETLRVVMTRVIIGFDMKLRKGNDLREGQWVEYNPELLSIPVTYEYQDALGIVSRSSSMLVHQLYDFRGHSVVQSVGRGLISVGDGTASSTFDAQFDGVSIYDRRDGYMTERVWALTAATTAGAMLATFGSAHYWHAGRISWLGEHGTADVGATRQVAPPLPPQDIERRDLTVRLRRKKPSDVSEIDDDGGLPAWPPLESE